MSQEQLANLLIRLREDSVLLEKLKTAISFDAAQAMAREAGFEISMADLEGYDLQLSGSPASMGALSDQELEAIAGGYGEFTTGPACATWFFGKCLSNCASL